MHKPPVGPSTRARMRKKSLIEIRNTSEQKPSD